MLGIYKPSNQKETELLQELSQLFDFDSLRYEDIIIMIDFNMTMENHHFNEFMKIMLLSCLINKRTYYQSKKSKLH